MNYLGDFKVGATVNFNITTHAAAGGAVAPSSAFEAADLVIYKNASQTQRSSTSGVVPISPFDSIVGLHHFSIDLADDTDAGFWAAGNDYAVILSPDETVDSQTVVRVVASFSIENRVVNWAQVVSPTTTLNLSGTTILTATNVETDTVDIQGRIPAALDSGRISASVGAMGANVLTASALATDAVTEIQSGLSTHSAADVWNVATRTLSGTLGSFDALWNKVKAWLGALAGKTADTDTRAEINATTAGATYNETTDSLQAISDAGGGGGGDTTVIVNPLSTTINDRVTESTIRAYYKENGWAIGPNAVVDAAGDPVDLTVFPTHRLTIEDQGKADVLTTTTVTVSGADDNQWTATGTLAVTATAPAKLRWSLRGIDTGVDILLGHGDVIVTYAASVDEA